jgi:Flp pilus assembly protein TadD
MVHRDIKPHNLMLAAKGVVKILDFGLARMQSERQVSGRLTQLDSFMGTPEYVSPEQAEDARKADTRSDIYSLGCTLYALLSGRPPFVGETATQIVLAHIEKEPTPLHELRQDVPAEVSAVVTKMLAKDPKQRFQTPVEVARALAPFAKAEGRPAAAAPLPLASAASTGTVVGSDTSKAERTGQEASRHVPRKSGNREPQAVALAGWWKRPGVLAVAAAGALVLLAGIIVALTTSDGAVILVEVDQPGAVVRVDEEMIRVTIPGDKKPIKIERKPGRHTLRVSKEGFDVYTEDIEFIAGKSVPVKMIRLTPKDIVKANPPLTKGNPQKPLNPGQGNPGGQPENPAQKPKSAEEYYSRGEALANQGKHEAAETELREALRLRLDYPEAHQKLGFALMGQGRSKEAEAELREAIRLRPNFPVAHNDLGVLLRGQGKHKAAEDELREAIRLQPDLALAHGNLGGLLNSQGRYHDAEAPWREAIRLQPNNAGLYMGLSFALHCQGKHKENETTCREALRLQPDLPVAHNNLGWALLGQDRYKEAETELREALRLKPDMARAHHGLGRALNHFGRREEALTELREAVRLEPGNGGARNDLNDTLRALGRPQ